MSGEQWATVLKTIVNCMVEASVGLQKGVLFADATPRCSVRMLAGELLIFEYFGRSSGAGKQFQVLE